MRDEELLAAARRGDAGAFEQLYRAHRDWVYSLALRFCGHRDDALDVVQETFGYLLRRIDAIELRGKLTTLLYPVVKHEAAAVRRRSARYSDEEQALLAARSREPAATSELDDLSTAVARVPAAQREVLLMRFVDDMALEEIARALAIPLGTVKSRLHHALAALRADARARRYFEGIS